MRLGDMIEALENMPPDLPVQYETVGQVVEVENGNPPGGFDSYRGYYDRLMLEPKGEPVTVAEFLKRCERTDGETFTGYKGGGYTMDRRTVVHIAEWGRTSRNRPVAIEQRDHRAVILVAHVPEPW